LYEAYNGVCSYIAHWIPRSSNPNVDHFIPKSVRPDLAYEWNNYRLACPLVNTYKLNYQDVLDPFMLSKDWFFLDFPSLLTRPNPELPYQDQQKIWATIKRLRLNEEVFVSDRSDWLKDYCQGKKDLSVLKHEAPFIAYELERQKLVEDIKIIMVYEPEVEE